MAEHKRRITASKIKYLLALYALNPKNTGTRCAGIARALGLSRPSVHAMIRSLTELQLVCRDPHGLVCLTAAGKEMAEQSIRCLAALNARLASRLSDPADAQTAAAPILPTLPPEHLDALCMLLTERKTGHSL